MLTNPFVQNVISDFITLGLLILIGWLVYYFSNRSKLLTFFGIENSKRIVLYLSHLRIAKGGAFGVDNKPRSFGSSAIPLYEAEFIPIFQKLFNFVVPEMNSQPGFLKWLLVSDVDVEIHSSPLNEGDVVKDATFVAIGSPGYNAASAHIENYFKSAGKFAVDGSGLAISGLPILEDGRCAFVQRVYDDSTKQLAFYVAGLSALGTSTAFYFLVTNWHKLHNKYPKNKGFCIMLRATGSDSRQYEVLYERS